MRITPPILTPRLRQIAEQITPCRCVADIGTDHAYLPTFLCMTQKAERGIASDIRQGPLKRAEATLMHYGMASYIETRLGGGVETLTPGEADCIVIAGMGGLMIGEILKGVPPAVAAANQILLQPMSAVPELRAFLYENGYTILSETLAKEEEKLYHILSVTAKQEEESYTDAELYFGKQLLSGNCEYLPEYIQKQKQKLTKMAEGLKQSKSQDAAERLKTTTALLHTLAMYE